MIQRSCRAPFVNMSPEVVQRRRALFRYGVVSIGARDAGV
jgi:hypothetical protein